MGFRLPRSHDLPSVTTNTSSTGAVLSVALSVPLPCARAMGARKRTMEKIQRSWIAQIRVQAGSVERSAEHL